MSQTIVTPITMVGNDFAVLKRRVPAPQKQAVSSAVATASLPAITAIPDSPEVLSEAPVLVQRSRSVLKGTVNFLHRYFIATFAVLLLIVGLSGSRVVTAYEAAQLIKSEQASAASLPLQSGMNLTITVSSALLQSTVQAITHQPISLTVGNQTISVSPLTITSWLAVTPDAANKSDDNIFVKTTSMISSLTQLADTYVKAPINQVSVSHDDGITPSGIIVAGQNGTALSNPSIIAQQVTKLAPSLTQNKGLSFNAPLATVPFQSVTPAAFNKLIEVDVTTKRMYVYQSGQLINSFLVSAGKPSTPTPLGEFQIWDKLTSQTMVGPGYVQPNVPWINYFDHSGDAIHGVYWRPASVFGNVNTSHGCVGLQLTDAEWIYNWAPIGTTVITYS